ncbi:MAG: Bug family tripartite tricarboxylate transporter substrate binding protein [Lautropia sp.]
MKGLIHRASLAVAALLVAGAASADYPDRTIQVIVPFPPGGSVDPIARAIQAGMRETLGANVVVENHPGAGGTLGTGKVARAEPDGYTLAITAVGPLTTQPHLKNLPYDVDRFEYVCRTHVTPQVFAVGEHSRFKTLAQFVDYARQNKGKATLSSTGVGSLPQLATVAFAQVAGFEWVHVPTKGDAEAAQLAIGGEIDGWVAGVQTLVRLSPKLRALGILEERRNPALPDIPTFKELGLPVVSAGWGGLVAPKGTPPAIVAKLSDACAHAVETPEFGKILQSLKVPPGYLPAGEFAAFVRSEYERHGKLIRDIGADKAKGN